MARRRHRADHICHGRDGDAGGAGLAVFNAGTARTGSALRHSGLSRRDRPRHHGQRHLRLRLNLQLGRETRRRCRCAICPFDWGDISHLNAGEMPPHGAISATVSTVPRNLAARHVPQTHSDNQTKCANGQHPCEKDARLAVTSRGPCGSGRKYKRCCAPGAPTMH